MACSVPLRGKSSLHEGYSQQLPSNLYLDLFPKDLVELPRKEESQQLTPKLQSRRRELFFMIMGSYSILTVGISYCPRTPFCVSPPLPYMLEAKHNLKRFKHVMSVRQAPMGQGKLSYRETL